MPPINIIWEEVTARLMSVMDAPRSVAMGTEAGKQIEPLSVENVAPNEAMKVIYFFLYIESSASAFISEVSSSCEWSAFLPG